MNARTFSTKVTDSQMANEGTRRRAGIGRPVRAIVSPYTTMVTTAERPRCSASSHIPKVVTNWRMTEVGASSIRPISIRHRPRQPQPSAALPKTTTAKVGTASVTLKLPAATAPTANL